MVHLGMELYAPCRLALYLESRHRNVIGVGYYAIVRRDGRDSVAVRHPYLTLIAETRQQLVVLVEDIHSRTTVLTGCRRLDLAAETVREILCSVTYPQYRQHAFELREVDLRSV